ncbi:sensor histidine kinase [Nocardioides sp. Soil774]|uniref:sensor histidine kinase n=1 Tax=Nocardioides sp. Soil774 TaxID=1736408 RepID=UPI000ACB5586|nr:ATP-binding protein [Nocardioides sp. Soil774]
MDRMLVGGTLTSGQARRSAPALTAAGWVVGAACTALILGTPYLRFGYHNPELHVVLDSVDACIALLLAYLLVGRLRRTRRLQDLLLVTGLVLLALVGLGAALAVRGLPVGTGQTLAVWVSVTLRTAAALVVVAAALAPAARLTRREAARGAQVAALLVLALVAALWTVRGVLPVAVTASAPTSAQHLVIEGHPVFLAAQALSAVALLFASLHFTRQARVRGGDEVLRWVGPGCALLGFARVNYLLFPSLYSGWFYTGDVLRTAGYVCLLVGATREIGGYWAARADVAVAEDRRRLARELHDGVVQELSWIRSEARTLSLDAGSARPAQSILDASDRALDEARAAVDALGRNPDEPLGYALHRSARDVAERHGARVVVELDDSVRADQHQRHALARIVREAVGNALRHGGAGCVRVTLEATPAGGRLVVEDDGRGFDVHATAYDDGYGLTSMRERAQELPGACVVTSAPGRGTSIEVTW